MEIPVYLFTGFLESGKSTLIQETLADPEFTEDEKTLLILCEDGEVEFDDAVLADYRCDIVDVYKRQVPVPCISRCRVLLYVRPVLMCRVISH